MDANVVKLSSTYPSAPMIYINNFTNENVKNGHIPAPPPIIKDSYSCFGKQIDPDDVLIKPLESHNIKCLYKRNLNNYKHELKKLNHSILMNYLDLLDVLVKAPNKIGTSGRTLREEKLEDLSILFLNMHHLINELRPKQACENLITILEMQKEQRLEIACKFQKHLVIIMDLLKQSIDKIKINNNELNSLLSEFNTLIEKNKVYLNQQQTTKLNEMSKKSAVDVSNFSDLTQSILTSTSIIYQQQQDQELNADKSDEIKSSCGTSGDITTKSSSYEYKDRILCDLIDTYLNNKIEIS